MIRMMDAFVQRLPRPRPPSPARSPTRPSPLGERPVKRAKVEVSDSDEDDYKSSDEEADTSGVTVNEVSDEDAQDDEDGRQTRKTDIESALPPVQVDKEAIEEYEIMRSSQASAHDDDQSSTKDRKWIRGKSSIYVDAFNLALDTVLADESHLFDAKERHIFQQWRQLDYEAQYL